MLHSPPLLLGHPPLPILNPKLPPPTSPHSKPYASPAHLSPALQVLGLRRLHSAPSRLESTCLLIAHGIDLFYTRMAPAKAYDSLEDDFAYGLLLLLLLGLSLGTVALHYVTKQASLKSKWA